MNSTPSAILREPTGLRAEANPDPREQRRERDDEDGCTDWNHDDGIEKPKTSSRVYASRTGSASTRLLVPPQKTVRRRRRSRSRHPLPFCGVNATFRRASAARLPVPCSARSDAGADGSPSHVLHEPERHADAGAREPDVPVDASARGTGDERPETTPPTLMPM
jgi:hypothetical protein